jgi:Peptidase family M23/Phage-related minor tail protein
VSVFEVMARLSGDPSGMVAAFASGGAAAREFERITHDSNARVLDSNKKRDEAIKHAAVATAAVVAGVSLVATDMAADFEKSTMRLQTSGGMTKDTLGVVRDGILEISKQTGFTAQELADGMFTVSAAGYSTAKGLDILRAASQGAAAEGTDLSIMTSALTTVMKIYNLTEADSVGITNELVTASGLAKGTMQEFAGSLSTVLPVAASAGISFADVAGAITIMTNKGTTAQQATQELRNAITNLQAPNQVAVKQMSQLGISSQEVSGMLGERGLSGTIKYLTETVLSQSEGGKVLLGTFKESTQAGMAMQTMISGMPPELQKLARDLQSGSTTVAGYTKEIRGMEPAASIMGEQFLALFKRSTGFSDALKQGSPAAQTYVQAMEKMMGGHTGLQVALQLGGESMAQYEQNVKAIGDAHNRSTTEVYTHADSQSTMAASLARSKAEVAALMIEFGEGLIPAFKDGLAVIVDIIHWFREHETAGKILIGTFVAMTSVLAGYAIAQWAANSALLAFPGTQIVLILAAVVAGLVMAYENIGWFRDFVDASWKVITDIFSGFMSWWNDEFVPGFSKGWDGMAGFFTDSVTNITKWNEDTKGMFNDFGTNTVGMVEDFNTNTNGMFTDFVTNTTSEVESWNTTTTGMFEDFNNNTKGMFNDFFDTVAKGWEGFCKDPIGETEIFFATINEKVNTWINDTAKAFGDWVIARVADFNKWSEDTNTTVRTWAKDTLDGFNGWSEDTNETVRAWAADTWNKFVQWGKDQEAEQNRWKEQSKTEFNNWSTDTNETVRQWAEDTWNGFNNWANDVNTRVREWSSVSQEDIDTFNRDTNQAFSTWWTDTQTGFRNWGTDVENGYENWKNSLTGKTRTFVENTEGMFRDFNNNTKGMFDDFGRHLQNWGNGVKGTFEDTVRNVGTAWEKLRETAAAPIRFVVNKVYNEGLRPAWNNIAGSVGLEALKLPEAKFHTGGIMPGYSPGVDNHIIAVGGGEAIMRPEWTRAVGPENIHAMNAMAAQGNTQGVRNMMGLPAFADGGIVGGIASFFANPAGAIGGALTGLVRGLLGGVGGGKLGQIVSEFPIKIIGGIIKKATDAIANMATSAAAGNWSGGPSGLGNPLPGALVSQNYSASHNGIDLAKAAGSSIMAAGAGRISFSGWSSGGGGNEIHIDHPNGLQTWYAHMLRPGLSTGVQVAGGQTIGQVGSTGNSTGPHLHFMVLNGGWPNHMNPRNFIPNFDDGGTLMPGMNLVNNATGSKEVLDRRGPRDDDLAERVGRAVAEALQGARFEFDGDGLTRHVAGRLVLEQQRRAGRG